MVSLIVITSTLDEEVKVDFWVSFPERVELNFIALEGVSLEIENLVGKRISGLTFTHTESLVLSV